MVSIKSPKDIESLREGGKRLAFILYELAKATHPGVSARGLNDLANKLVREGGDKPAFLGYKPRGAKRPYPSSLCVSVNDEIVHGISNEEEKFLKEGDIVSLDMGLNHKGLITDSAITVAVGKIDKISQKLINATREALALGIKAVCGGGHIGDIGFAIENFAKTTGFSITDGLAGHGVGYKVHEDPFVPNFGKKGDGLELKPGMVLAIEPMLNVGTSQIILAKDGYTYKTADGARSAHFEHTVLITEKWPEILTKI